MARGELERQATVLLWRVGEPPTVADVQGLLTRDQDLAYITVTTVLDRLAKKGLVRRERRGRAWYYKSTDPQPVVLAREMADLLRGVPAEVRDEALRLLSESLFPPSLTLWPGVHHVIWKDFAVCTVQSLPRCRIKLQRGVLDVRQELWIVVTKYDNGQ